MKKIGILLFVLVLAMGMMGIGYAMWSEDLTIEGTVYTGEVNVTFSHYSNDGGEHGTCDAGGFLVPNFDPKEPGTWNPDTQIWDGEREIKNVASTNCELTVVEEIDTLQITLDNAYPCYFGSVLFDIENTGSIPVKVNSVKLVGKSKNGVVTDIDPPIDMVACTWYYVDVEGCTVRLSPDAPPVGSMPNSGEDFALHLSDYDQFVQIDPGFTGYGDITMHLEQDALMNTTYDAIIEIVVANWNEPPPGP